MVRSLYNDQNNSIEDICKTLGISRATLYRYLAPREVSTLENKGEQIPTLGP